jgi:biotin carboxylase
MTGAGTLLVVGGSHAEIPLIGAAKRMGYTVVTTGNRADDLGHRHADRYVPADYSDPEQVHSVAVHERVEAIVSGCNDFAALSTASVCDELGLAGHDPHEIALRIHHKDLFRELLDELGLESPRSGVVRAADEAVALCERIGYPVIVKPVDLTGGKGMTVCDDAGHVARAVDAALALSRQHHVVVEQYLTGTRHGFTCFVHDGQVGFRFADDEQYYLNPFLVSGTTTPTSMPGYALAELVSNVELISTKLGLVDGLVHVQCIMTPSGPQIIEVCRRCPGDLYPVFVELSTGYDYAGSVVRAETGADAHPSDGGTQRPIARHCVMAPRSGVVAGVEVDASLRRLVVEQMWWWAHGDVIEQHLTQKLGIVFCAFDGRDEMVLTAPQLTDLVRVEMA